MELIDELRADAASSTSHPYTEDLMGRAADEIERLRAALKPFADLGSTGVPNQGWIDEAHRVYYGTHEQSQKTEE